MTIEWTKACFFCGDKRIYAKQNVSVRSYNSPKVESLPIIAKTVGTPGKRIASTHKRVVCRCCKTQYPWIVGG